MSAGRTINTQSQSWGTPHKYVNAVKDFFYGKISLDPCSNEYSIVNADVEYIFPQNDGLRDSWNFSTIYVNPPYGSDKIRKTTIKDWLKRCYLANEEYGSEVIALVPVATNTGHWKNFVYNKATAICFLYDTRLKFLEDGKDVGKGAPMSCCLIYWGERYDDFFSNFLPYGAVIDLRNLKNQVIGTFKENMKEIPFED
ncbi:DNA N-6-adenine-methyltransferase [Empedobacter brevis]